MCLGPVLLLMEDRPHPQIMLCGSEGVFNLGKLYIGVPQDFRICLFPVGTEDIAAAGFQCPPIAFIIFLDVDGKATIFFSNSDGEE